MSESRSAIAQLLEVMARLRNPEGGCPWDLEQTFATIAPYTIEEAYEVADAIERGDPAHIRDELGDLLFQVVFHARMAEERGWFDFESVAQAINDKLVRRHPHVFSDARFASDAERAANWEEQKAQERAAAATRSGAEPPSALGDVPRALPALSRAVKLGRRASRVNFDWPDASGIREKLNEELRELDTAVAAGDREAMTDEFGDVLFTLVNLGRKLDLDGEESLRGANAKFERRFRQMEALARARGLNLESLSPAAWDALWVESKRTLAPAPGAPDKV
jgi:nucleoside triphosphate diphosphatase